MTPNPHKFWVVTYPTALSILEDIMFQTDAVGIILQARGGLEPEHIALTTSDINEAETLAQHLLSARERDT